MIPSGVSPLIIPYKTGWETDHQWKEWSDESMIRSSQRDKIITIRLISQGVWPGLATTPFPVFFAFAHLRMDSGYPMARPDHVAHLLSVRWLRLQCSGLILLRFICDRRRMCTVSWRLFHLRQLRAVRNQYLFFMHLYSCPVCGAKTFSLPWANLITGVSWKPPDVHTGRSLPTICSSTSWYWSSCGQDAGAR